jgi:hypothetical protein
LIERAERLCATRSDADSPFKRLRPSDAARTLAAAWHGSENLRGVQARIPKSVCEHDKANIARELANYPRTTERSSADLATP